MKPKSDKAESVADVEARKSKSTPKKNNVYWLKKK